MRVIYLLFISSILSGVICTGKFSLKRDTSAKPRSLFGLLAFLTGYNLGHGLAPTSYQADIRDNTQLHLFAKLFNNALSVTYGKYVVPYTIVFPMQEGQLPLYPPLFSSNTNIPLNQQQIVNINEAPKQEAEEKYDEIHVKNEQDIDNHFDDNKIGKNFEETTKNEEEAESNEVTTQVEFISTKQLPSPTSEKPENNSITVETTTVSSSTSTTTMMTESSTTNSYGKYPYPIYHYYANRTNYENIAITTAPKLSMDFPESFEKYLPEIDSPKVPFAPEKIEVGNSNNYLKYYPSPYDSIKHHKYSNKVSDSEFKPIDNYFNEIE